MFVGSDGCADASASGRHNGRSGERELQPWVNTDEFSELEALDESNSVRTVVEYALVHTTL